MSPGPSSPDNPTVVLVHGAFAESASWNGVISLLDEAGFPALAFANPLRGVKSDSDYLATIIDGLEGDLILVGHSYGGSIISQASAGKEKVKGLVFVGGFAPEVGESGASLSGKYEGGTLGETLETFTLPDGTPELYIMQDKYHSQFAADVSEVEAQRMAVTQRPIPEAALNEESLAAGWKTIPSWFIFGSEDKNIPVAVHRFMAERAGSKRTVEIAGGSHSVGIPEAAAVVELIREAALSRADQAAVSA